MNNANIIKVMEYLTSSVDQNKVTDVEKLTLAIGELENFPMTFDVLDESRVGQILQSIRHSKELTMFLTERIRSLIKSWRQLLNSDVYSVVPNLVKSAMSKTPATKNGIINHKGDEEECIGCREKYLVKSRDTIIEEEKAGDIIKVLPEIINGSEPHKIRKLKVKSTKELLADFSGFIENDIKDRILLDRISQEDDDIFTYFHDDQAINEAVHVSIYQQEQNQRDMEYENQYFNQNLSENEENDPSHSNCDVYLKQFASMCSDMPEVVLTQFLPWENIWQGLPLLAPLVRPEPKKRIRKRPPPKKETPLSLDFINNMLENFEVRAKQKELISAAIQERQRSTVTVDNTRSIEDLTMTMKIKVTTVDRNKTRHKKKLKRMKKKKKKPVVIKMKVRKPRKKRVKPMPPVTNYLDDMPVLPPLMEGQEVVVEEEERVRPCVEVSAHALAYGVLEGYTHTRQTRGDVLVPLTSMYSHTIGSHYLHVFPWVDLADPPRATFPADSHSFLRTILDIAHFGV